MLTISVAQNAAIKQDICASTWGLDLAVCAISFKFLFAINVTEIYSQAGLYEVLIPKWNKFLHCSAQHSTANDKSTLTVC